MPSTRMRSMLRTTVAVVLLMLGSVATGASAQSTRSVSRVDRVDEWLHALVDHTPGEVDDRLRTFASWPADTWQYFLQDSQLFALLLQQPDRTELGLRVQTSRRRVQSDLLENDIRELRRIACAFRRPEVDGACASGAARLDKDLAGLASRADAARANGDEHYVLRLGTLLHTDLVTWAGTQYATTTRQSIAVNDGQQGGSIDDSLHWTIAYGLLDAIVDQPVPKGGVQAAWIRDWYVASAMLMQQTGRYDQLHLERGLRIFSDDPELRFLSACQHEIDASPVIQHAMESLAATLPRGATSPIQNPRNELQAAASDLRAAIARRPDWGEAHLRLGRVLARAWQPSGIDRSSANRTGPHGWRPRAALPVGAVPGRVTRTSRSIRRGKDAYEQASALFPSAPSARLAISQLARRQGDGDGALAAMKPLLESTAGDDTVVDPWWQYSTLQARDAEERFERLRTLSAARAAR